MFHFISAILTLTLQNLIHLLAPLAPLSQNSRLSQIKAIKQQSMRYFILYIYIYTCEVYTEWTGLGWIEVG